MICLCLLNKNKKENVKKKYLTPSVNCSSIMDGVIFMPIKSLKIAQNAYPAIKKSRGDIQWKI